MSHFDDLKQPGELWIPVAGWDGYLVSSHGRIFSLKQNRLMAQYVGTRGYFNVGLSNGRRKATVGVARLMLLSFHPTPDSSALQTAHRDGVQTNNKLSNLRWATPKENSADKFRHGTMMMGDRHYAAKLSSMGARVIRRLTDRGVTPRRKIAKVFGISLAQVARIAVGTRWKSVLEAR